MSGRVKVRKQERKHDSTPWGRPAREKGEDGREGRDGVIEGVTGYRVAVISQVIAVKLTFVPLAAMRQSGCPHPLFFLLLLHHSCSFSSSPPLASTSSSSPAPFLPSCRYSTLGLSRGQSLMHEEDSLTDTRPSAANSPFSFSLPFSRTLSFFLSHTGCTFSSEC